MGTFPRWDLALLEHKQPVRSDVCDRQALLLQQAGLQVQLWSSAERISRDKFLFALQIVRSGESSSASFKVNINSYLFGDHKRKTHISMIHMLKNNVN